MFVGNSASQFTLLQVSPVGPDSYQPVSYTPSSIVPAGSTAVLKFTNIGLPQITVKTQQPVTIQAANQSSIPISSNTTPYMVERGGGEPVKFDLKLGQSIQAANQPSIPMSPTVIPYMVQSDRGDVVATLDGLGDSSNNSWLALGAIALAAFALFGSKK